MALDQWEGLKPAHGDQIGVMVPVPIAVSLDVMARIVTLKEVEPVSIEAVEDAVADYVCSRQGRTDMSGLGSRFTTTVQWRTNMRRSRDAIADLYGWEIED